MPQRIDKYEILEPLSRGAAGIVYRAVDSNLKRSVALKIFGSGPEVRDELRARMLCEAKLWSALGHPNLVSIHDVGDDDGTSYVVMEMPEGLTLDQVLAERTPMSLEEKISIAVQLASALHYAHQRGLVHGDIRPANIVVAGDRAVKLGDFGMEKPLDSLTGDELRASLTPYAAPEQLRARVDAYSDQYSLAAVLYELLAGSPPPPAGDESGATTRASTSFRMAPPDLAAIVERALSADPADRYPDLRAMRAALEAVLQRLATAAAVPVQLARTSPSMPRAKRIASLDRPNEGWAWSNQALIALASAAAISLIAAYWSTSEPSPSDVAVNAPRSAGPDTRLASTRAPAAATPVSASKDEAEAARDRALAARFGSAKAEATYYAPEIHLAAQRKEAEADAAIAKNDYITATVLYDMARDGYDIAAQKSELKATTIEKQNIDAQLAAEAQARDSKVTVSSAEIIARPPSASYGSPPASEPYARMVYPSPSYDSAPYGRTAPEQLANAGPRAVAPPKILEIPRSGEDPSGPGEKSKSLGAFAAIFAEPTDGNHHGGTWGACWRGDSASARACAQSKCEDSRRSSQPCVQVALSRPGQHCAVARATGFGVSSAACGSTQDEAEQAALGDCRQETIRNYGSVSAPCAIAWSTAG